MAFTLGLKAPKQTKSNGNTYQNTLDRLVTVKEYDLAKNYLYAEDDKGKKYEVFINPEEVKRATEAAKLRGGDVANNWMGHNIDEKMKKAIPPGQKVVLTRSRIVQNDKTRDLAITEVHRIGGVPNPKPNKTFQALSTMSYRMDEGKERIARLQCWNANGVSIEDEVAMNKLKQDIDNARANVGKKHGEHFITEPTIGIQFRAAIRTDKDYEWEQDPTKKAIYEVVDTSVPFDWIPGPEGADGKPIKEQAHNVSGDEFISFAELYINYVTTKFQESLDKMKVEVCYYHLYPASKNNNLALTTGTEKDKNADKNPLYQLSHHKSFIDLEQTEELIGRNAAVNGIIQLSDDKVHEDSDGNLIKVPSNWVSKVHANNIRGHIHAFIRTADGHKTKPHPNLDLVKRGVAENGSAPNSGSAGNGAGNTGNTGNTNAAPVAMNKPAQVAAPVETDFDPFASSDFTDPFASPEVPAKFTGFGSKE